MALHVDAYYGAWENDDPDDDDGGHAAWCGPDCDGTYPAEAGAVTLRCDCACHDTVMDVWW